MKQSILAAILILTSLMVNAQSKVPYMFESTTWDFGRIAEADGPVTGTFRFTNYGDRPIVITDVVSSCSCAVPEYSAKPVKPKSTGYIKVRFDPAGLPETNRRTLSVVFNDGEFRQELVVYGKIDVKPDPELDFNYDLAGGVRIDRLSVPFALRENRNLPDTALARVYNNSGKTVRFSYAHRGKTHLVQVVMPATLKPGEAADVRFILSNPEGKKGYFTDEVFISVDGERTVPVVVSGILVDDPAELERYRNVKIK